MSAITPDVLFTSFKNKLIKTSEKFGQVAIPTSLVFEFFEEKIYVYHDLEGLYNSEYKIKTELENVGCFDEFIEPVQLDLKYNDIDFAQLEKDFIEHAPKIGFPNSSYSAYNNGHFFWLGYDKNLKLETSADIENLCYNSIARSFDHLNRHFFGKISIEKSDTPIIYSEKVKYLVPYWSEHNLNCFYINSPEGFVLRSSLSIEFSKYLTIWYKKQEREEEEDYYSEYTLFDEILFILYRICARLQKEFIDHPLFEPDFECFPCSHDIEENINKEYQQFAKETLTLSIEDYLVQCESKFKK